MRKYTINILEIESQLKQRYDLFPIIVPNKQVYHDLFEIVDRFAPKQLLPEEEEAFDDAVISHLEKNNILIFNNNIEEELCIKN